MSRYLLMPFGWLYGTLSSLRNRLYDRGIIHSYQSRLKTIVIGNLQVGGSGKTPHTALIYDFLKDHYKIAILSRGYGRKTKGLQVADDKADAETLGDESFWYYQTLKQAKVVVAERRKEGLQYLEKQAIDVVLLDDAYQHRAVTCTLNILLTDYKLPYYDDHVMPYGRLREWKTGDKRAHIIIVTKCPENMSLEEKIEIIQNINPYDFQNVFFTSVVSLKPFPLKGVGSFENLIPDKIIAMSGIANPDSFTDTCSAFSKTIVPLSFNDHHSYNRSDIKTMLQMMNSKSIVLTTEKDAVKLQKKELMDMIPEDKVFVLPVKPQFLFREEQKFRETVRQFLK